LEILQAYRIIIIHRIDVFAFYSSNYAISFHRWDREWSKIKEKSTARGFSLLISYEDHVHHVHFISNLILSGGLANLLFSSYFSIVAFKWTCIDRARFVSDLFLDVLWFVLICFLLVDLSEEKSIKIRKDFLGKKVWNIQIQISVTCFQDMKVFDLLIFIGQV